ncbi:MarR family winged helix-turn-helix transcriptional regulator [Calycomorphotria hydatis]|uniref:Transcriptional regulator SlyA n=1 Tax=Calycomorphotria hydatis TaxID=2528027 RepID=A0A517T593_9PLAN|nr:MarR family winged helix-turn-helix transcriptional regulator [Calycomorphotria hydatis]QDT63511.1 transcriptional regulator SlyA [Calycomorphotria hydatis]
MLNPSFASGGRDEEHAITPPTTTPFQTFGSPASETPSTEAASTSETNPSPAIPSVPLNSNSAFGSTVPNMSSDSSDAPASVSFTASESVPSVTPAGLESTEEADAIAGRISPDEGTPFRIASEEEPGALVENMLRVGHRLRGLLDSKFSQLGLSDARFVALKVIREAAPHGCTQAHLATRLGQCESSISTLVERMRASQLLYRLRSKADRRKRVLMLTEEGRRLLDLAAVQYEHQAEKLCAGLSFEERQALAGMLNELSNGLERVENADSRHSNAA